MSSEYLAFLASSHEVTKDRIDWPQQGMDFVAVLAAPLRQQHSVKGCAITQSPLRKSLQPIS
jgi:hypothetical protein